MRKIWTCEQAWEWREKHPWIVGCNYVPGCCINGTEIWQEEGFEEVFTTIRSEIKLAAGIGMNSVRMMMPYNVWKYQREGFLKRLERILELLDGFGFTLMPVFFDDCGRGPVELYLDEAHFGKQSGPVKGWHGGYPPRKVENSINPTYSMADDPSNWPEMESFVKDIVSLHKSDPRILMWDVWNEPGNSGSGGYGNVSKSMQIMEKVFEWIRGIDAVHPLTAGCWDFYHNFFRDGRCGVLTEIERRALELSDVISYHYYGDYEHSVKMIEFLKSYKRPLFITEWLHRPLWKLCGRTASAV